MDYEIKFHDADILEERTILLASDTDGMRGRSHSLGGRKQWPRFEGDRPGVYSIPQNNLFVALETVRSPLNGQLCSPEPAAVQPILVRESYTRRAGTFR
jgi:hypothetical protein